jgi:hypothetical protein
MMGLTEKWAMAQVERLKQDLFGSGVPLAVSHGALHPLSLLSHGYKHNDPAVKAHKWQWDDIEDLAQFQGCWLFIEPLLLKNCDKTIRAYRTSVGNMKIFMWNERWRECFRGYSGLRQVAKAGNIKLLLYAYEGRDQMASRLGWPETPRSALREVLLSGNVEAFYALWSLGLCAPEDFWTPSLLSFVVDWH